MNGTVKPGMGIKMMASGACFNVVEVGIMTPKELKPTELLAAGQVGYIAASIKSLADTNVGDTVTSSENPVENPLPGYKKAVPMVF